jgi:hypothetical protein
MLEEAGVLARSATEGAAPTLVNTTEPRDRSAGSNGRVPHGEPVESGVPVVRENAASQGAGGALPPASPKCCDTDDRHSQAQDLGHVQTVSASSKGKDQTVPPRPVHRKQQAAEKYE